MKHRPLISHARGCTSKPVGVLKAQKPRTRLSTGQGWRGLACVPELYQKRHTYRVLVILQFEISSASGDPKQP